MMIRKIITALKIIEISLKKVKIEKSIHTNIEKGVNVYNHGKKLQLGKSIYIRQNASINTEENGEIVIEDNVFINRNTIISCRDKITIRKGCAIGPNVCIYDHDHIYGNNGIKSRIQIWRSYNRRKLLVEQ